MTRTLSLRTGVGLAAAGSTLLALGLTAGPIGAADGTPTVGAPLRGVPVGSLGLATPVAGSRASRPGDASAEYTGVATVSGSDAWAVGIQLADPQTTFAEHWDGSAWAQVATPDSEGSEGDQLSAVAAVSSKDVWAVGNTSGAWGLYGLIEHWNGKKWKIVKSPNSAGTSTNLLAVTAISTDDVWATGFSSTGSTYSGTMEHWNGKKWKVVKSPNPDGASLINLEGMSASGPDDVWASGFYTTSDGYFTLVEHWNGKKWKITNTPNPDGAVLSWLPSITAASPKAVWAVGATSTGSGASTLVEHWNGKRWKIVASPNGDGSINVLLGSTHASKKDVWAVGTTEDGSTAHSLTEHWNGKTWSIVDSPDLDGVGYLDSASADGSDDVWAAGLGGDIDTPSPLAEHWNGSSWSIP